MLRALLLAATLAAPAAAQSDLSAEIAASGLAAVEARLAALPAPTDADRFALGGVRFLGGIEQVLQKRYQVALDPAFYMLPVLRLPIPDNPAPQPLQADFVRAMFADLLADMDGARAALAQIPETSDFTLEVRVEDLWFDIDADGRRAEGEGFYAVTGAVLFGGTGFDPASLPSLAIRFDVADSRWLSGYAAVLQAVGNAVLAYDPTDAIARMQATRTAFADLNRDLAMVNGLDMMMGRYADVAAVVDGALRQQPDPARGAAAHAAALAVIADNRAFWRLVRTETDDTREWVPNDRQTSALGLRMPEGAGDTWLSVLSDAELLLQGRLLIPYWRLGDGAGLNLQTLMLEPRPVDIVAWVEGTAALPYAQRGPRISAANWRMFDNLMNGQGLLFAAFIN
jgi:hypothetical protein